MSVYQCAVVFYGAEIEEYPSDYSPLWEDEYNERGGGKIGPRHCGIFTEAYGKNYVYTRDSLIKCNEGESKPLATSVDVTARYSEWRLQICEFCDFMGLKPVWEPHWRLMHYISL